MNYLILKNIIETTLVNYRCKDCGSQVSEGNINILGSAGNSVNLEAICPNCKAPGVIKAEIGFISNISSPEVLNTFKNTLENIKSAQNINIGDSIKDADILSLRDSIKNSNSIEDLFKS